MRTTLPARVALDACRAAWQQTQNQLSIELPVVADDSPLPSSYGANHSYRQHKLGAETTGTFTATATPTGGGRSAPNTNNNGPTRKPSWASAGGASQE